VNLSLCTLASLLLIGSAVRAQERAEFELTLHAPAAAECTSAARLTELVEERAGPPFEPSW
jgi:hypothetical protein